MAKPKSIPLSVVARFVGPDDPDENGIITSQFLTCYEDADLGDRELANYMASLVRTDGIRRGNITEAHVCTFIGMRRIDPTELSVLLSFLQPEAPNG